MYPRAGVGSDSAVLIYLVGGGVLAKVAVPVVPAWRHVSGVIVAIEVLADENSVVACIVEPGGYRGALASQVAELLEAPQRQPGAPDAVVVRILAPEDGRP